MKSAALAVVVAVTMSSMQSGAGPRLFRQADPKTYHLENCTLATALNRTEIKPIDIKDEGREPCPARYRRSPAITASLSP